MSAHKASLQGRSTSTVTSEPDARPADMSRNGGADSCGQKLPRAFYERDTVLVARELLGKHLIHRSEGIERVGRIVEVEAYLGPHDRAAHSSKGLTARTKVMFGPPGHAYVYMIYGIYYCINVVTQPEGQASAVLLRALER